MGCDVEMRPSAPSCVCAVQLEPSLSTPQLPALCNGSGDTIFESTLCVSLGELTCSGLFFLSFFSPLSFFFFFSLHVYLFSMKMPHSVWDSLILRSRVLLYRQRRWRTNSACGAFTATETLYYHPPILIKNHSDGFCQLYCFHRDRNAV